MVLGSEFCGSAVLQFLVLQFLVLRLLVLQFLVWYPIGMQRRWIDLLAIGVVLAFGYLALVAQWGAMAPGSPPLDPVWAAVRERGMLRVATDVGFRPFADERDGELVGYDVDLARALAAELGLAVEFVPTGFDALYDSLTSGRADLVASALPYAPELGFRARFSSFYFDAGLMLLVPAESSITSSADLTGLRVGAVLGSEGDSFLRRQAQTQALEVRDQYDEPAPLLADLRRGELDAVIVDHIVALSAVQSETGLRIAQPLTSDPYALALPRSAFQLEAEVNRALEVLRAEGFFIELNQRHFR